MPKLPKLPKLDFFTNCIYRAPAYIQLAAKRKLNDENIFVVGVKDEELKKFWRSMKAHALEVTIPEEKGKAVIAIDSRCHANTAELATSEESKEDWFDQFVITSKKNEGKESARSYELQLSSSTQPKEQILI